MAYAKRIILGFIIIVTACLAVIFILGGVLTYAYFFPILQTKDSIMNNNNTGLTLLDDKGQPFFSFYSAHDTHYVKLSDISDYAKKAAIASEDEEFYKHGGFSIKAIARSIILDIQKRGLYFGGSTITQQLVKNSLLSSNRNLFRKFQELILAVGIEKQYSKNEILEMYLNSVYFGQGAFGIENASQTYFGKPAKDLNVAESSFIIGILSSPSELSPYNGDINKARDRQKYVLGEMLKNGFITGSDYVTALNETLDFKKVANDMNILAPHFALMVRDDLIKKYGEETIVRSGFTVKTTINSEWQKYAEESVAKNVHNLAGNNAHNGAAVVMDPHTGQVKALVGSVDWYDDRFGKVNMAISPRQPGSSFKPIVYGTAFEDRVITPATILPDVPSAFKIPGCYVNCLYKPRDYDGKFRGNVTVRRALANSLNVPAVYVLQRIGVARAVDVANYLGLNLGSSDQYGLSLVLGAAEVPLINMVDVYSSFANGGEMVKPNYITQIIDKKGDNIYSQKPETVHAWDPEVAFLISSILSDNNTRAEEFGNLLNVSRPAAVKTGTTTDYKDAWTIGYTPDLVVGVWVGNNDNRPMDQVAGSLGAAPIWRDLIEKFSAGTVARNFTPPEGIAEVACATGAQTASASGQLTARRVEYFISGTEPSSGSCYPSNIAGRGFQPGIGGGPPTSQDGRPIAYPPKIVTPPANIPTPSPSVAAPTPMPTITPNP